MTANRSRSTVVLLRWALPVFCIFTWVSAPTRADPMPRVPRADASYETRGQIFAPSIRLSHFEATNRYTDDTARDFYFSPGVGFRVASPLGHALLVDGEYRFPGNIAVSLDARDYAPIRFGVIHLGYAFRYLAGRSRVPRRRRRWTITPHLSLSTGAARKRDSETVSGVPLRSPVVGARVGVDLDVHIRRVFFGWSFGYEYLRHTRGTLTRSNFFIWNVLPLLRIGVNFGRSIR